MACHKASCRLAWRQLMLCIVAICISIFVFARFATDSRTNIFLQQSSSSTKRAYENGKSGFVSLCYQRLGGNHRLGNHLFMLAAMMYVATRTDRQVIMKPTGWCLDDVFQLNIKRFNASGIPTPMRVMHPPGIYNPDPLFEKFDFLRYNLTERTLALCGLYQTYVYADAVASELRQVLQLKPEARRDADIFFEANRPAIWKPDSYFKVGIHVRRGDFLSSGEVAWGLTVITEQYLNNSMNYFMSRHERVQFFICTDDIKWSRNSVVKLFSGSENTSVEDSLESYRQFYISKSHVVTISVGHSTAADLAILVSCDAVITSTGSFSWWAGWLSNKTTIYYANWPRSGTTLDRQLNRKTYNPVRWIPMT